MTDAGFDRRRYRRILRFASKHLLLTWWYEIALPKIGMRGIADRTRKARMRRFASQFRFLAVDLGGLMIKLGQYLSSRLDVLPPEITKELDSLQDEVPAVAFDRIRAAAEAELGIPLERAFASFEPEPIAAASLGQAYRATLGPEDAQMLGFERVVVKVQRPGIESTVAVDIAALRRVGIWLSRVRLIARRANVPALVEEFAVTSLQEIDYFHEAHNCGRFGETFADNPTVHAPTIVWERTTTRVLTLEDVSAIKITDLESLKAAGIDPSEVALAFARIMFDQLFLHGFFHADPHPGNLFVEPVPAAAAAQKRGGRARRGADAVPAWRITFIDFGMMGEIPPTLRTTLRTLVIAAAARDGRGMVDAAAGAGVLLPSADPRELERVMAQVFERFGGMGFAELREVDPAEFKRFAREFSDVLLSLPFQLPENFLLLLRTVSLTSGVCSSLDPAYNIWDSVEPYAQQLIRAEGGNLVVDLAKEAVAVAGVAVRLPRRLDAFLNDAMDGRLELRAPRVEKAMQRADRANRRMTWAIVFSGLIVAGAIARPDDPSLGNGLLLASLVPLALIIGGALRR